MARAHEGEYFRDGHVGGAIIAGWFFLTRGDLRPSTVARIARWMDDSWCSTPLCDHFPDESADPALEYRAIDALLEHTSGLRQAGHNIILPTLALRAVREVPAALTPMRVEGICRLLDCFTTDDVPQDLGPLELDLTPESLATRRSRSS